MVIAVDECTFLLEFLLGELGLKLLLDSLESLAATMLVVVAACSNSVCLCVASLVNLRTEFLIVYLVAIFTLNG